MPIFRNLTVFKRNFARSTSTIEPVRLAYASYESTDSKDHTQPPLIIKHGLFGSKSNWNSLCKVYHNKTQRKVIAVDARNHGDSPHSDHHTYEHLAVDLWGLLQQLKLERAALLGHSMGGRAVMYFALNNPNLVEKLIVADISPVTTSPNLKSTPQLFNVMQSVNLPKGVSMAAARAQTDVQLSKFISDKGLRNFLLTNLIQTPEGKYTWRVNIPVLMSNFHEIAKFPMVKSLRYEGPVLFIGGGDSDYITKSDHEEILKLFPNAQFRYIEGAGHWLHSEKPTEFLEHTVSFLNQKQ